MLFVFDWKVSILTCQAKRNTRASTDPPSKSAISTRQWFPTRCPGGGWVDSRQAPICCESFRFSTFQVFQVPLWICLSFCSLNWLGKVPGVLSSYCGDIYLHMPWFENSNMMLGMVEVYKSLQHIACSMIWSPIKGGIRMPVWMSTGNRLPAVLGVAQSNEPSYFVTAVLTMRIIWGFPKMLVPNNYGFSY